MKLIVGAVPSGKTAFSDKHVWACGRYKSVFSVPSVEEALFFVTLVPSLHYPFSCGCRLRRIGVWATRMLVAKTKHGGNNAEGGFAMVAILTSSAALAIRESAPAPPKRT
jgi:hypothetical protein